MQQEMPPPRGADPIRPYSKKYRSARKNLLENMNGRGAPFVMLPISPQREQAQNDFPRGKSYPNMPSRELAQFDRALPRLYSV